MERTCKLCKMALRENRNQRVGKGRPTHVSVCGFSVCVVDFFSQPAEEFCTTHLSCGIIMLCIFLREPALAWDVEDSWRNPQHNDVKTQVVLYGGRGNFTQLHCQYQLSEFILKLVLHQDQYCTGSGHVKSLMMASILLQPSDNH